MVFRQPAGAMALAAALSSGWSSFSNGFRVGALRAGMIRPPSRTRAQEHGGVAGDGEGAGPVEASWCGHELSSVVTTDWLADHVDDPSVAIVDIRGEVCKTLVHEDGEGAGSSYFATEYAGLHWDYVDAHVPGAAFCDWTKDIAFLEESPSGGAAVPAQLAGRDQFVTAMEERGVGAGKKVVVYDNGNMLFATRFWWAMRCFGHDGVSVLDGGWAKWLAEGRPVTADGPCPLKVYHDWGLDEDRERPWLRATIGDLLQQVGSSCGGGGADAEVGGGGVATAVASTSQQGVQILDARSRDQYTGEARRARRGGRVPGALNTPYKDFLEPEGGRGFRVLKGRDGIREVFRSAGVSLAPPEAPSLTAVPPVMAYCNGGVASTLALFCLHQLGHDRWKNYDGSWNEWGNRGDTPVVVDSESGSGAPA